MNGDQIVQRINEHIDSRFDKVDEKLDKHLVDYNTICKEIATNTESISWLKKSYWRLLAGAGSATGGAGIIIYIMTSIAGG